jgi:predicted DNA-binding transcriptional regulator AlpA
MHKLRRGMRLPEVEKVTGQGKTSIYKGIKEGTFPRPAKTGPGGKISIFDEDEIAAYNAARFAKRDGGAA